MNNSRTGIRGYLSSDDDYEYEEDREIDDSNETDVHNVWTDIDYTKPIGTIGSPVAMRAQVWAYSLGGEKNKLYAEADGYGIGRKAALIDLKATLAKRVEVYERIEAAINTLIKELDAVS